MEMQERHLLIVDSLGYSLFRWLEPHLQNMQTLAKEGIAIEAKAVADSTTPAIASILSGLLPEHHGVFTKEVAKESSILSLPEIANASGLKSAVIMEKNGAEVHKG
ncbi:MAG: sulfatase-like hydrolase/transferase [Methanotrichaceae archaeon]|nr:sulfatase-like hydrolase/transferase [Methanotrichaceae archaeon]